MAAREDLKMRLTRLRGQTARLGRTGLSGPAVLRTAEVGIHLMLAAVLAGLVNSFLIVNAEVPTGSMENTIMAGDRILALRTSYWFDEPEAGDIVVFRYPDDETGKTLYVKRIIGTPGDTVEMSNGTVYVNGKALQEDYIAEVTQGSYGPYVVPNGCYFMMGDNRNHSQDSRFWRNQYVEKDEILGKVVLRYYKGFKWIS
jgi:signal peptidase I